MRKKAWIYLVILILMISITGCVSGDDGEEKEPEKVVTPVISPKGGTFLNEASVTITTETDGAVIRYTTDESEPGADSKIYDSAITITATTIIKAKAFKDGMTESDTATETFTIQEVGLEKIEITSQPTKTSYYVGSTTLDITGLEVTGTYNNGSSKKETVSLSNITGFNTITSGEKTLTVKVSGETATFKVTVVDVITTAEFTLKRKVDVLELNEYSALFEVTDSSVTELKFLGTNSIAPLSVKIADKKGTLSSIKVGQEVTEITIKAVDINGNQIGNTKKVAINN